MNGLGGQMHQPSQGHLDIVCIIPEPGGGWSPITHMVRLASRLLDARLTFIHPAKTPSIGRRALSQCPRLRRGERTLLAIVALPSNMVDLVSREWFLGYRRVAVWVIDDFWVEFMPRMARRNRTIDHVFVMNGEVLDEYRDCLRVPVTLVPWGTDTRHPSLTAGRESPDRTIDVLRLGRQPRVWADDASNREYFAGRGITYAGRFPMLDDAEENHRMVFERLATSKIALASSSSASPADYTHDSREYITARWCDAMAAGTLVAGVLPECQAAQLLPAQGLIRMPVGSRREGLPVLRRALAEWNPSTARAIRESAVLTLDWRHRFATITRSLGLRSIKLERELAQLLTHPEA